jgi:trehalose utilization protein
MGFVQNMILFDRNSGRRTTGILAYYEDGTNTYPEWEDDTVRSYLPTLYFLNNKF